MIFARSLTITITITALNGHPMEARGWREIRAFAGRLKKWVNLTRFALFRSVR